MTEYKYYVLTNDDTSEENVLFAPSLDIAIEFFNELYLSVHDEKRVNVERLELVGPDGENILTYDTHMGVLNDAK